MKETSGPQDNLGEIRESVYEGCCNMISFDNFYFYKREYKK